MSMAIQANNNYNDLYLSMRNNPSQGNANVNSPEAVQATSLEQLPTEDIKKANSEMPKEQVVALYYNHQATQLAKDTMDVYLQANEDTDYSTESVEVSLSDINELHNQLVRTQALENVAAMPKEDRPQLDQENFNNNGSQSNNQQAIAQYNNYQTTQTTNDLVNIYA